MAKAFKVLELSYIGDKLCKPGDIVYGIENPGKNLEAISGKLAAAAVDKAPAAAADEPATGPFKAVHIAGGAYTVVNADGGEVGERFLKDDETAGKAKADAMAKADELNLAANSVTEGGVDLPDA